MIFYYTTTTLAQKLEMFNMVSKDISCIIFKNCPPFLFKQISYNGCYHHYMYPTSHSKVSHAVEKDLEDFPFNISGYQESEYDFKDEPSECRFFIDGVENADLRKDFFFEGRNLRRGPRTLRGCFVYNFDDVIPSWVVEIQLIHQNRPSMSSLSASIEEAEIFDDKFICKSIASFLNPIFASHTIKVHRGYPPRKSHVDADCESSLSEDSESEESPTED